MPKKRLRPCENLTRKFPKTIFSFHQDNFFFSSTSFFEPKVDERIYIGKVQTGRGEVPANLVLLIIAPLLTKYNKNKGYWNISKLFASNNYSHGGQRSKIWPPLEIEKFLTKRRCAELCYFIFFFNVFHGKLGPHFAGFCGWINILSIWSQGHFHFTGRHYCPVDNAGNFSFKISVKQYAKLIKKSIFLNYSDKNI